MELDLYFKPIENIDFQKGDIGCLADIYIKNFPDWESADIVILSVNENRGDLDFKEGDIDHFALREKFYQFRFDGNVKIADLGILQPGAEKRDTFSALQEITSCVQKNRNC